MDTTPEKCPYCALKTEHHIHKPSCQMAKYLEPPFSASPNVGRLLSECRQLILDEWPADHPTVASVLEQINQLIGGEDGQ